MLRGINEAFTHQMKKDKHINIFSLSLRHKTKLLLIKGFPSTNKHLEHGTQSPEKNVVQVFTAYNTLGATYTTVCNILKPRE